MEPLEVLLFSHSVHQMKTKMLWSCCCSWPSGRTPVRRALKGCCHLGLRKPGWLESGSCVQSLRSAQWDPNFSIASLVLCFQPQLCTSYLQRCAVWGLGRWSTARLGWMHFCHAVSNLLTPNLVLQRAARCQHPWGRA